MDLICIAHEGNPYGHVTINGAAATTRQLGRIAGMSEKEAGRLVHELENAGVFSRTDAGTIYSRRMVRDNEASEAGREAIKTRWNSNNGSDQKPTNTPIRGADSLYSEAEAEAESKPPSPPKGAAKDDPEFLAFWSAYPRKDDKGHARKAWAAALKRVSAPTILAGLTAYRFNTDPQYIPLPATWLNGERWGAQITTLPLPPPGPRKTTPTYGSGY